MKRAFALALTCVALAACAEDEADDNSNGTEPIEIVDAGDGGRETRDAMLGTDASPPDASTTSTRMDGSASDASRNEDASSMPDSATADGSAPPGWKLVWSDEFDGPANALPNASSWVFETGGGGWGNNQLEFDTNRAENAALNGNGELVITARKESYMGRSYTSARLKTQGKFEHGYGRYEARMRIPFGQGMWPAFWMLGANIGGTSWPDCGEIDIMENIGREPDLVHGTLHGPGYSGGNGIGASSKLAMGRFADDYHVFAIEWEKEVVRWYVDGKLYQTRTPKDLPSGARWVYDHNFFVLLNLAVGGQWPGNPDATTTFPQTLKVDYVRVYDRQ